MLHNITGSQFKVRIQQEKGKKLRRRICAQWFFTLCVHRVVTPWFQLGSIFVQELSPSVPTLYSVNGNPIEHRKKSFYSNTAR